MKLKICGMKYNTEEVALLNPDYLGFIFWEPSARFYNRPIDELTGQAKKVGVFVDAPIDQIILHIHEHGLKLIQLHGNEDPAYCKKLMDLIQSEWSGSIEVIKAFSIDQQFDFSNLEAYENVCDYFLFDTKGELPGGTGKGFDWRLLKKNKSAKPFFLSGGIGLDDTKALKEFFSSSEAAHCYAIDVNSKFEKEPGLKQIEELEKFMIELGIGPLRN